MITYITEVLDSKDISETSRQFLRNWHANKEAKKRKKESGFTHSKDDSKITILS